MTYRLRIRLRRRSGWASGSLFVLGCALLGCHPGAGYVQADRLTYEAVAGEYLGYVDGDQHLSNDQKERRHGSVASWEARIVQAESEDEGE